MGKEILRGNMQFDDRKKERKDLFLSYVNLAGYNPGFVKWFDICLVHTHNVVKGFRLHL